MVPTPLFYQLLVVALVLVCLLIHVGLPDMPLPKPQPPSSSQPFPLTFYTRCTAIRSNSTNFTPCSVPSETGTCVNPRPSSGSRSPPPGSGPRSIPRPNCW